MVDKIDKQSIADVEKEFRREVLTHPKEYPQLYKDEVAKNRWNLDHQR